MTAPALEGVESGTVTWSILAATQDTNDADRQPNFGSFRGAVLFTPSRTTVRRLSPTPYTIFLDPVLGNVGDDGILRDLSGLEGVVLISPNATGTEETGWTWEASFQLNQREKVSFSFTFDPDEVVDLTRLTPIMSSPGFVMTKGEKGDAATIAIGAVTTSAPGSAADVDNVGTPNAAVLDFVLPRGATPVLAGTSTTSFAIGTGSKIFVTQAGMALVVGQWVRINNGANASNYMAGLVTAYSGTNLTVNVTEIGGAGTFADWNISLSGVKGTTGNTGPTGPGYTSRGAWVTGTAYAVRDIVTAGGSVFEVLTAHTSGGSAPTVAAPGANYRLWAQKGDQGPTGAGSPDATTTAKGSVQLAGDLGGTAAAPTVPTKVSKSGDTMTGDLVIKDMGGIKVPSQTNKFYTPDVLNPMLDPFPSLWHDVLAFNRHFPAPTYETSADGATGWTGAARNDELFAQKENQNIGILTDVLKGARWTWTGINTPYSNVAWLVIGFAYDATNATRRVLLETSTDGITWTTRHDSTHNATAQPVWHAVANWFDHSYVRLSLIATTAGNVRLSAIRMLSYRWGDQGGGSELEYPFSWDAARRVGFQAAYSAAAPVNAEDLTRLDYVQERDRWTPTLKTGATYTFALTDETNHIAANDTIAQTYTIPPNSSAAFPLGAKIQVSRLNTGTLTLAPGAGVTINAQSSIRTLNQYDSVLLVKYATDTWLIVDHLVNASETISGTVELATAAETTTGTDNTRAVHPAGLKVELDKKAASTITANTQTGTAYTLVLADAGKAVEMNNAAANTLTIPPNSSVAFPVGTVLEVMQLGAGQTTVAFGAGVVLRAPDGAKLAKQYASASLRKRATDEWVLAGNVIV